MADQIRVGVRVRPLGQVEPVGASEAQEASSSANSPDAPSHSHACQPQSAVWTVQDNCVSHKYDSSSTTAKAVSKPKESYYFDHVFNGDTVNEHVYVDLAKPVVDSVLAGYNGTFFAYGQTASGKTHSMFGTDSDSGVMFRAIDEIMAAATKPQTGRRFSIRISFCEIYNEIVRDLLDPSNTNVRIREQMQGSSTLEAKEVIVTSAEEAYEVLRRGQQHRAVGDTARNNRSSRSHAILSIIVESSGEAEKSTLSGTLHLVDLAGSERQASTNATGVRLTEAANINKSLLTLGTVIKKLTEKTKQNQHIPYRDSKLTRILQHSLGGNARTAVLCTISSAADHYSESVSTLSFAERVKTVKNTATRNELFDYEAKYYEAIAELSALKAKVALKSGRERDSSESAPCADSNFETLDSQLTSQVALTVEVERARNDAAFYKKRAQSLEAENTCLMEKSKEQSNALRSSRSRVKQLREAAEFLEGRQATLESSLAQALSGIEEARSFISQSQKKGSRVLRAQDLLYCVSEKLKMFVSFNEQENRQQSSLVTDGLCPVSMTLSLSSGRSSSVSSNMSSSPPTPTDTHDSADTGLRCLELNDSLCDRQGMKNDAAQSCKRSGSKQETYRSRRRRTRKQLQGAEGSQGVLLPCNVAGGPQIKLRRGGHSCTEESTNDSMDVATVDFAALDDYDGDIASQNTAQEADSSSLPDPRPDLSANAFPSNCTGALT